MTSFHLLLFTLFWIQVLHYSVCLFGANIWWVSIATKYKRIWVMKETDGMSEIRGLLSLTSRPLVNTNQVITLSLDKWLGLKLSLYVFVCYLSPTQRWELSTLTTTSPLPSVYRHVKPQWPSGSWFSCTTSSMAGDCRDTSWLRLPMAKLFFRAFSWIQKRQDHACTFMNATQIVKQIQK